MYDQKLIIHRWGIALGVPTFVSALISQQAEVKESSVGICR